MIVEKTAYLWYDFENSTIKKITNRNEDNKK